MTTFLNHGPSQGVATLEQVGPISLWSDGNGNTFRAAQASQYVRVETRGGCFSAANSDFVVEGDGGLRVVKREDWAYAPVEQNPPVPEVRVADQVWDDDGFITHIETVNNHVTDIREQRPAQTGSRPPVEIPPRWRLERQNLEPIRALCDKAGLSHLGRRPDLINRLREYAEKTATR